METAIFDLPFSVWGTAQKFEFATTYLIPIITCVAIIIVGIWTLYKYFNEKNRNFYLNILENVYAPLFEELIKMEYSRKLLIDDAKDKAAKKNLKLNQSLL